MVWFLRRRSSSKGLVRKVVKQPVTQAVNVYRVTQDGWVWGAKDCEKEARVLAQLNSAALGSAIWVDRGPGMAIDGLWNPSQERYRIYIVDPINRWTAEAVHAGLKMARAHREGSVQFDYNLSEEIAQEGYLRFKAEVAEEESLQVFFVVRDDEDGGSIILPLR